MSDVLLPGNFHIIIIVLVCIIKNLVIIHVFDEMILSSIIGYGELSMLLFLTQLSFLPLCPI